jgi:DNA (cytosine-5)-methyltransferase 1
MEEKVKRYSIGSLFAGIGGFELGLERAIPGAYTLWQVEQNNFCQKVLAKHWPEARIYDDVKNINKNNVEQVDILCGGFPCQDISVAGKGEGLNGERSGLWWEMHRIIDELQPRAVIMENVAAITIRGLGAVLGSLSQIGYDAEWCTLRASDFGAPHKRARWFCIAYPRTIGFYLSNERNFDTSSMFDSRWTSPHSNKERKRASNPVQPRRETSNAYDIEGIFTYSNQERSQIQPINTEQTYRKTSEMFKYSNRRIYQEESITYSNKERSPQQSGNPFPMEEKGLSERRSSKNGRIHTENYWESFPTQSPLCRRDDGIPNRVDRIAALGNAIVPQCSEWIGKKLWESGILQAGEYNG